MERKERIVFYDGECGFCNSSVQFILSKRKQDFFFAPLQSQFAIKKMSEQGVLIEMDTLYYLKNDKIYERSSAALAICRGLKGFWPLLTVFWVVPKFIRDAVYNYVAKRRHRIKRGFCVKPLAEEEQYFLDRR